MQAIRPRGASLRMTKQPQSVLLRRAGSCCVAKSSARTTVGHGGTAQTANGSRAEFEREAPHEPGSTKPLDGTCSCLRTVKGSRPSSPEVYLATDFTPTRSAKHALQAIANAAVVFVAAYAPATQLNVIAAIRQTLPNITFDFTTSARQGH